MSNPKRKRSSPHCVHECDVFTFFFSHAVRLYRTKNGGVVHNLLVFYSNFVPKTHHTVFEVFDFKNAVTLKNRVRDASRSLEMSPFDRAHIDVLS